MRVPAHIYKNIITAKLFIDGHFQEPIDLDRIARQACLSRFHFHRLFHRIYRMTPHQYLTRRRMELARQHLSDRQMPIAEVGFSVGFESLGSFSSLFKREHGVPPALYRQQLLQKAEATRTQPLSFVPACFLPVIGVTGETGGNDL